MRSLFVNVFLSFCLFAGSTVYASTGYNKEEFEKAQKGGEKILLHFHANWCPTCKKQEKILKELDSSGELKSVNLFVVNFDAEKDLKKSLNVSSQSTLVAFNGPKEVGRSSGLTDRKKIKEFIEENFK